jgi:hypothetical protein
MKAFTVNGPFLAAVRVWHGLEIASWGQGLELCERTLIFRSVFSWCAFDV